MNNPRENDAEILIVIIVAAGSASLWAIWHFQAPLIVYIIHRIRYIEFSVLKACLDVMRDFFFWIANGDPNRLLWNPREYSVVINQIQTIPPSQVSLEQLLWVAREAGWYLRWPVALILLYLSYRAYNHPVDMRFRRQIRGVDALIGVQHQYWRNIKPIHASNPLDEEVAVDDDDPTSPPPWASAKSRYDWIAGVSEGWKKSPPSRALVSRKFAEQLARTWNGTEELVPHEQALFAVFALKARRRSEEAHKLLGDISEEWADTKISASFDDAILNASHLQKSIKTAIAAVEKEKPDGYASCLQHGFSACVLLSLLAWAREEGGVLAPSEFLWLKPVNRHLWYALNNLGRRTFHVEGAGTIAHWLYEQSYGRAFYEPKVDEAVTGLFDTVYP